MPTPPQIPDQVRNDRATFIPHNPEMMVGIDITMVMAAKYFMALFKRLLITVESNSLVPLIISR